jgi:hypothetical protein
MTAIKKNINIIHNCEERFYNWLKSKLSEKGINFIEQPSLSDLLEHYERELLSDNQHLKPLQKWDKVKNECLGQSRRLNGQADQNHDLVDLIERTAFEGQILWLTFQED